MQGERNAKFICAFPSRSLISSLRSKDKVSEAEKSIKFICAIPRSFYHAIPVFAPWVSKKVLFLAWQSAAELWLMDDGWWMMVRVIPLRLHSYITKVHKSVGYGWGKGKGKGWLSLSSPLHRKVTIYLHKKSVRNIQKIKYPRIFNEIIADTRWNIHGYVMKYPRIFEEFGKADGIICPIGQTLGTLLATFLCAVGDNGRVFSLTLSSS